MNIHDFSLTWFVDVLLDQEPTLFATSVMENIRYGKAGATDVEVSSDGDDRNLHM